MNIQEFKQNLDNRLLGVGYTKATWDAACKWADQANENGGPIEWNLDSGFKLDYDGPMCQISSRFYPPHKTSLEYNKYHGKIRVLGWSGNGDEDCFDTHEIEAETLDQLQDMVEKYVSNIASVIHLAIKTALKQSK